MAKVMKTYEFPASKRMRYPWDKWLDGQIWELSRGDDFKIGAEQMRRNVYGAAWSRGLRVRTTRDQGNLILQAFHAKEASTLR